MSMPTQFTVDIFSLKKRYPAKVANNNPPTFTIERATPLSAEF